MPPDASGAPLAIGVFGVNERNRKTLEFLFKMQGQGRFFVASDQPPVAAIVDLDGPIGAEIWSEFRAAHPTLPTIVMSVQDRSFPNTVVLRKPVGTQQLIEALHGFERALRSLAGGTSAQPGPANPSAEMSTFQGGAARKPEQTISRPVTPPPQPSKHATDAKEGALGQMRTDSTRTLTKAIESIQDDIDACGDADDIDLRMSPALPEHYYYHPEHRFQHISKIGIGKSRHAESVHMLAIDGLEQPIFFLPDEDGLVITRLTSRRLRFFCLVELTDLSNAMIPIGRLPDDLMEVPRIPFERFHWEVTLWTSRGRIPEKTPLHIPLRLKHWPNFTRLLETPHAMRLAALWTQQPRSLAHTCEFLEIPQRYVFAFFSAAHAANLVEWVPDQQESGTPMIGAEHRHVLDRRAAGKPKPVQPSGSERRGLLGRILSHLLGKN